MSGWGGMLRGRTFALSYEGKIIEKGIPRGLGRSYGDASFCEGGYTWLMPPRRALLKWEGSLFIAEAGMSFYEVIQKVLPQGWFPAVVPGTQFVTLGGAFASNIHGKNHHRDGSFADHVEWIELRLPNGELRHLTPQDELFWATAGGLGLTGIIEVVALRLRRVPSSYILHEVRRARDWDELLSTLETEEIRFPYAVAWIDHTHQRNRGIIHLGRFSEKGAFRLRPSPRVGLSFTLPFSLINRFSAELIAASYWAIHKAGTRETSYADFFFPLDRVKGWNRLWGRKGFVQFHFIVPQASSLERLWSHLRNSPARSFLTVLKRLGFQRGPLAFSGPGWSLAIDLPASVEVGKFLIRLADMVAEEGGRIYLTKDSLLQPEQAQAMYPAWESFRQLKAYIDPEGRLRSNLSKRLRLTE